MSSTHDRSPWRNSTFVLPPNPESSGVYRPPHYRNAARNTKEVDSMEILPPDRDLFEGLKKGVFTKFEPPTVADNDDIVRIKDCQFIGSYSWTNRENPTIIVPGTPPQWQSRSAPYNVQPDRGFFFIDQNGYRMPRCPLLPLIVAVTARAEGAHQPNCDWPVVDFVTDRSALRNLVRWAAGSTKDFRIDLELAGDKTVLMSRWEKKTRDKLNGRTFLFNFERASTLLVGDCREATAHYRIVSYDLNGLKMVVRFEIDACMPPPKTHSWRSAATHDTLSATLSAVDVSDGAPPACDRHFHLSVIKGGYEVAPSATMELATRSEFRQHEYDLKELYAQLFFSQTAHHVLAVHNRGRFTAIHRRKLVSPEFQTLDQELQPRFQAARKVLKLIQDLLVEHGERGRLTLLCKDGVLQVYERANEGSCLPDHLLALFKA